MSGGAPVFQLEVLNVPVTKYARSAYGGLVLYTIFDAFVRPAVRSSGRSFAKIACFLTVLKVASSRREQILR